MIRKLFNSYGELVEMPEEDHKLITFSMNSPEGKQEIDELKEILQEDVEKCGSDFSRWSLKAKQNRLFFYAKDTYENTFGSSKEMVAGAIFYFNQADGDICKLQHFVVDAERFAKGSVGFTQDSNVFKRQNSEEEKHFPELQAIMEDVHYTYDLDTKDDKSWDKNAYILTTSLNNDPKKNPKGMVWGVYQSLKKKYGTEQSDVIYDVKGNIFYKKDGVKSLVQIKNGILFSNGNVYSTPEDFFEAEDAGRNVINQKKFGNSPAFLEFLVKADFGDATETKESDKGR